jgi:lysophospholipase L1-like esterase
VKKNGAAMKRLFTIFGFSVITILILTGALLTTLPTIYTVGDSTMAPYDTANTANQRGWAQMLVGLSNTTVIDNARGGRSSKSFINEGLWAATDTLVVAGDYVFIQFGHNDEKMDTGSYKQYHTDPWTSYYSYLQQYVTDTRAKGGIPILCTPICRWYYSNDTITPAGMHNDSTAVNDSLGNYPMAMRAVAKANDVPLIDLTLKTRDLDNGYGSDKSSLLHIASDGTHPNKFGATLIARLAIQGMREQNLDVARYFDTTAVLYGSQDTVACGSQYAGAYSASTMYIISAFNLLPYAGTITVTAPDGFQVSMASSSGYTSSISLSYTNGAIVTQRIYVRFSPTEAKSYSDTVKISGGASAGKTFIVTGTGKAVLSGTRSTVTWNLTGSTAASSVTGFLSGSTESFSNMVVGGYAVVGSDTCTSQRDSGSVSWTAESSQNGGRYIQFAATASDGANLTIDTIRMCMGAAGGSGMRASVYYSTDSTFASSTQLASTITFTSNTISTYTYAISQELSSGKTLYVRVYPWYTSTAYRKYICLHHVAISGASSTTSIGSSSSLPKSFSVEQNYPNPFNPSTIIQYQLPQNAMVSLKVFDMLGKVVREVVSATQPAGAYTVRVDMSKLASGIYFYKLQAGAFTQTRKMLLMK